MNKEQAIMQLEYRKDFATPDQIEALDMAISALSEELSEDGTLTVHVSDGSKVNRVFVMGDNIFGGLYYPDSAENERDLISRQAVLDIWHTSYSDNREENEEIQYKKIAFELPSVENKGELISRQAIEEINSEIPKVHELFDIAYEYNKKDSTRTELSQKCTTYLLDVWQTLGAVVDNLPSAENKDGWIPVTERLPENNVIVLCCAISTSISGGHTRFVGCCNNGFWFVQTDAETLSYPRQYEVTAWQPLPEPYKAESEVKAE